MSAVGMIGLGQIGRPMAANLLQAGHAVIGFRRTPSPETETLGVAMATSARDVAERCKIVLCCIPNEEALEDVVCGPRGIAAGDCSGRIVVELSTLSTAAKQRQAEALAAKGGVMLDCAVSGLPGMVMERQGVVFASGDEASFQAVRGVLDAITTKLFYMGPFGAALNTKLCANMLVAINIAATAETLAFGRKLGIDPLRLVEALKDGAGGSLQFSARAARMATGDWMRVMGSTAMLAKDLHLIRAKSAEIACPTPIVTAAARIYEEAMAAGYAETDVAAIYAIFAKRAGLAAPGEAADTMEKTA